MGIVGDRRRRVGVGLVGEFWRWGGGSSAMVLIDFCEDREAYFCGESHQQAGWKWHKKSCTGNKKKPV